MPNLDAGDLIALLSLIVPLGIAYLSWRQRQLRREEVYQWASEAIDALETVVLLCIHYPPSIEETSHRARREEVLFKIPCLIERGRLFFRNERSDDWGQAKLPAYQGYRPVILDTLVTAYQVADHLQTSDPAKRKILRDVSVHALKQFVSLAQKEVGRAKTSAKDTRVGGSQVNVARLLASASEGSEHP